MPSFNEQLTDLMFEKGISPKELAAKIGVNTSSVNDWRSNRSNIFLSNALKIVDLFECSLEFLMGRTETVIDYIPQPCPPFYAHFVAVLKKSGFTTYRMRKESPIKGAYFNKWKHGSDPVMPTLLVVADFLGITLDYLVGRDPSPNYN